MRVDIESRLLSKVRKQTCNEFKIKISAIIWKNSRGNVKLNNILFPHFLVKM